MDGCLTEVLVELSDNQIDEFVGHKPLDTQLSIDSQCSYEEDDVFFSHATKPSPACGKLIDINSSHDSTNSCKRPLKSYSSNDFVKKQSKSTSTDYDEDDSILDLENGDFDFPLSPLSDIDNNEKKHKQPTETDCHTAVENLKVPNEMLEIYNEASKICEELRIDSIDTTKVLSPNRLISSKSNLIHDKIFLEDKENQCNQGIRNFVASTENFSSKNKQNCRTSREIRNHLLSIVDNDSLTTNVEPRNLSAICPAETDAKSSVFTQPKDDKESSPLIRSGTFKLKKSSVTPLKHRTEVNSNSKSSVSSQNITKDSTPSKRMIGKNGRLKFSNVKSKISSAWKNESCNNSSSKSIEISPKSSKIKQNSFTSSKVERSSSEKLQNTSTNSSNYSYNFKKSSGRSLQEGSKHVSNSKALSFDSSKSMKYNSRMKALPLKDNSSSKSMEINPKSSKIKQNSTSSNVERSSSEKLQNTSTNSSNRSYNFKKSSGKSLQEGPKQVSNSKTLSFDSSKSMEYNSRMKASSLNGMKDSYISAKKDSIYRANSLKSKINSSRSSALSFKSENTSMASVKDSYESDVFTDQSSVDAIPLGSKSKGCYSDSYSKSSLKFKPQLKELNSKAFSIKSSSSNHKNMVTPVKAFVSSQSDSKQIDAAIDVTCTPVSRIKKCSSIPTPKNFSSFKINSPLAISTPNYKSSRLARQSGVTSTPDRSRISSR